MTSSAGRASYDRPDGRGSSGRGARAHEADRTTAQTGMPTALLGMLLFIASEVMFFGGLFATYFNARASVPAGAWGPPEGAHELDIALAGVLTAILLASSFTMQFGVWAIRRGDVGKLRMWTGITLVLGVLFLMGQLYDYSQLDFGDRRRRVRHDVLHADRLPRRARLRWRGRVDHHPGAGDARPVQPTESRGGRGGQHVLALRGRGLDRRLQHHLLPALGASGR